MKISQNWLNDYIKTDIKTAKIGEYLTDIGLEVEGIESFESIRGSLQGIVVGRVLTCEKHPNADKLRITTVDIGNADPLHIVCGAPNVAEGQTVPIATVGTTLYAKDGHSFQIKEAKIRGELSQGMICSEDELGLSEDHDGIMVLDESRFEIGTNLADYFELTRDHVFEIGLTPNRTDAMSHYGVARDLHAFLSTHQMPSSFEKASEAAITPSGTSDFKIEIEDEELCPKYLGAVIENVQVKPSPDWLRTRLQAIGLSSINNVVDVTNYILHSLGHPLHAFDASVIEDQTVRVGTAEAGTKFTTLDGVERKLSGTEIMIKDGKQRPLCLAGVFGGENSGVTESTTTIFLESACFSPIAVRRAAKLHGLNTDASFRFERGVDPKMTRIALTQAIKLIEELTGGKQRGEIIAKEGAPVTEHYVILRFSKVEQILGTKIHKEKIKEILKALGISVLNEIQNGLEVSVPAYRADVTREIDVIEEILRIYGYNKIESPEKLAFTPVKLNPDDQDALENSWARTLQSNGFYEVMNNSLTNVKDPEYAVKILNPLSSDLQYMRKSLLEGLLTNADYNIKRKSNQIKFFELGKIYHKKESYEERKQLAMLVTGRDEAENWLQPKSATDFYRLKSYVKILLDILPVTITEQPLEDVRFSEAIELTAGGKTVARIGIVASPLLKDADLSQPCFYAEIEVEACQKLRENKSLKFHGIPKFNKTRKDLALLVDRNVSYAELYSAALKSPGKFLKSVQLFDVYEGDKLPAGKKSYAMSFELLNEEKTLEDKDIAEVMNGLIKIFQKEFGAELRS